MQFIQVLHIARELVHLRHDGHHHVKGIGPPPEVSFLHRALVTHHLDGSSYLVGSRHEVIHIDIGLETNLPIAEEHEVLTLAISLVFP